MSRTCAEYRDQLADLAEGKSLPSVEAHVAACADCAKRLDQLKTIVHATRTGFHEAPESVLMAAIGLMPARRRERLGLLRSTFGFAGARAATQDFQLVVGNEEHEMRLMFVRGEGGWEVLGRTPSSEWTVSDEHGPLDLDGDGRFRFEADTLAATALTMTSPAVEIQVPSAEELLNDSDRPR